MQTQDNVVGAVCASVLSEDQRELIHKHYLPVCSVWLCDIHWYVSLH